MQHHAGKDALSELIGELNERADALYHSMRKEHTPSLIFTGSDHQHPSTNRMNALSRDSPSIVFGRWSVSPGE